MRAAIRFRDNSKWRTFPWCSACFPSSWSRLQTIVEEASSSVFQEAERRTGCHPKIALNPALRQGLYSLFILTSELGFERFCSPQESLRLVDFWLRALERCRRSCTPSIGTRLKVEKPGSDPQRNCLDWRAHQVWWINSVRKSSGNIFEGWWFFCYVFTYCWLLSWRTKLKLTPCTKLADTKWKTSKTALKTDL